MDPIVLAAVAGAAAVASGSFDLFQTYSKAKRRQRLQVRFGAGDREVVIKGVSDSEARAIVEEVLTRGSRRSA